MATGLNNSIKAQRSNRSDSRERQVKAKPKGEHMPTPSDCAKECCISSSNTAVCGTCSAQIFENNKALICKFWFCIKCSRLCDEVYTLLAKSEVSNSILWFCEGCNRAFPKAKGMLNCIQFMESKLNESDVKPSNLSKMVDDVVDRFSKVEHRCQTRIGLSTTNITIHSNPDLLITVRECIMKRKK